MSLRRNPISWVLLAILASTIAVIGAQSRRPVKPVAPVLPLAPLELAWSVDLPFPPSAGGTMDRSRIYVPLEGERLVALSRDTGAVAWTRDVESNWPPLVVSDTVFVIASDEVHALDSSNGSGRWNSEMPGAAVTSAIVTTHRIVVLTDRGELVAYEAATGGLAWRRTFDRLGESPGLSADGQHVYLTWAGLVQAFALDDGRPRWERSLTGRLRPAAVGRDRIFVGSSARALHAIDANSGAILWTSSTGGEVAGVAVDGDTVYLSSLDNLLRAVNRSNGNQRWKRVLPSRPSASPVPFLGLVAQPGLRPALSTFLAATGEEVGTYDAQAELRGTLLVDPWPRARAVGAVAITKDGQAMGLRSTALTLRETAAPLTTLPGRTLAREVLPTR